MSPNVFKDQSLDNKNEPIKFVETKTKKPIKCFEYANIQSKQQPTYHIYTFWTNCYAKIFFLSFQKFSITIYIKASMFRGCYQIIHYRTQPEDNNSTWWNILQKTLCDPKMKFLRLLLFAVRRPPIRPTIKKFSWHCSCPTSNVRRPTWCQYSGVNLIRRLHFRAKHFRAKRFRAKQY